MSVFTEEDLTLAIMTCDLEYIRRYLASGASLEDITLVGPDGSGRTPLELAAIVEAGHGGSADVTKAILDYASPAQQCSSLKFFASEDAYLELLKVLLRAGVHPDISCDNQTALQLAAGNSNLKAAYLLLSYGADPCREGKYGSAIVSAGHHYVLKAMLESAARGEVKSPYYFTDLDMIKARLIGWANVIQQWVAEHEAQTFYVFAVEGFDLVANSEEAFAKTLAQYRKDDPDIYADESVVRNLRFNKGDFSFRIEDLPKTGFFSEAIKLDFSCLDPQPNEQRTPRQLLVDGLRHNQQSIFAGLTITDDFTLR